VQGSPLTDGARTPLARPARPEAVGRETGIPVATRVCVSSRKSTFWYIPLGCALGSTDDTLERE